MKKLIITAVLISSSAAAFGSELETMRAGAQFEAVGIPAPRAVHAGLPAPVPADRRNAGAALPPAGESGTDPADKARRQKFRELLGEMAGLSQSRPLSCEERSLRTPPESAAYTLALQEVPEYQDAFFILFRSRSRSWSSLIAYEGENGHLMGTLAVTAAGDTEVYRQVFDGFFDDIMSLDVVRRKAAGFYYQKLNPQGVEFYSLACKAGDKVVREIRNQGD